MECNALTKQLSTVSSLSDVVPLHSLSLGGLSGRRETLVDDLEDEAPSDLSSSLAHRRFNAQAGTQQCTLRQWKHLDY